MQIAMIKISLLNGRQVSKNEHFYF